jgi:hypothetical protein
MSIPAGFYFRQPAISVISAATPDTVQIDSKVEVNNTAFLSADPTLTAVPLSPTPIQIAPAGMRNSIVLTNAVNGQKIHLGVDNTLATGSSLTDGVLFGPGVRYTLSGYTGAVWALGVDGPTTLYYKTT